MHQISGLFLMWHPHVKSSVKRPQACPQGRPHSIFFCDIMLRFLWNNHDQPQWQYCFMWHPHVKLSVKQSPAYPCVFTLLQWYLHAPHLFNNVRGSVRYSGAAPHNLTTSKWGDQWPIHAITARAILMWVISLKNPQELFISIHKGGRESNEPEEPIQTIYRQYWAHVDTRSLEYL